MDGVKAPHSSAHLGGTTIIFEFRELEGVF